jgi:hypothetical protein
LVDQGKKIALTNEWASSNSLRAEVEQNVEERQFLSLPEPNTFFLFSAVRHQRSWFFGLWNLGFIAAVH